MAESRVAFLAGCAVTGSVAFALAKGWVAVGAPAASEPAPMPAVAAEAELPPPPPLAALPVLPSPVASPTAAPAPLTLEKIEEQLKKQAEQNKETITALREEIKQQRADVQKLRDDLNGQDKTLTTMALDEKLARLVSQGDRATPNAPWNNGILWALGGMVLTVSSIVMAWVFATMGRQTRASNAPVPQPFNPIRVVPTYLPARTRADYAGRRDAAPGEIVDYDY